MPWNCPKCGRQFKYATNYHSCVKVNADSHFINKKSNVRTVYGKILKETKKIGTVNISPVQTSIMLKNVRTFLGMHLYRESMDVSFFLPEEKNEFPVHKTFKYGKNKKGHTVRIENPKEVDRQLISWMKISCGLAGKKK